MLKQLIFMLLVLIPPFLLVHSTNASTPKYKTVNIPIESGVEILHLYKNYIVLAYKSIGYKVNFHEVSPGRGLIEVNEGRLDAVILRVDISDVLTNLIKIPVPLTTGSIMLYCQKSVVCHQSIFDDSANFIGVIRGSTFSALYMSHQQAGTYQVVDNIKMAEMFNKDRLDYILTGEDDRYGSILKLKDDSYQKITLQKVSAYHFVNRKLAHLIPELTVAIQNVLNQ